MSKQVGMTTNFSKRYINKPSTPANNDFAHYAAKQLWDIHTAPDYEEYIALLKK
ncbi:hypothetical protein ACUVAJ_000517 [Vibrio cholerae]